MPKISGQSPGVAFTTVRAKLAKIVTTNFYNAHIALVDSPNFDAHLGNAKREIAASSCMILTRPDVARLVAVVKARRKAGVSSGAHPERSQVYECPQPFDFMCWGERGKGERMNATFKYVMLKEQGRWYIHHLDSVGQHSLSGGILSASELEPGSESELEIHDSDYESDESFHQLRDMSDDEDW